MRFLLAGSIIFLVSACLNQPDCLITATNQVKITLKKVDTDEANSVLFDSITISGTDSTFQDKKKAKVSSLLLYVNPRATQTTFRFKYHDSMDSVRMDTITVTYHVQNAVVGPECGAFVYYSNLAVLSSSFASVFKVANPKVVNSQLSTSSTSNLEIKL